jgi:flavodoxin
MNSLVIYFSQTGNTQKVATAIQSGIKSATGQCDIVKLKEANVANLSRYDLIGLGCPTFAFREPENVTAFIKSLARLPVLGRHCFVFATHGGHPGNVLTSMASKLERVGLKVIGGFNCDGQLYLPFYVTPWFTDGHPDDIDLKLAAEFGADMANKCGKLSKGELVPIQSFRWLRGPLYRRIAAMAK